MNRLAVSTSKCVKLRQSLKYFFAKEQEYRPRNSFKNNNNKNVNNRKNGQTNEDLMALLVEKNFRLRPFAGIMTNEKHNIVDTEEVNQGRLKEMTEQGSLNEVFN